MPADIYTWVPGNSVSIAVKLMATVLVMMNFEVCILQKLTPKLDNREDLDALLMITIMMLDGI